MKRTFLTVVVLAFGVAACNLVDSKNTNRDSKTVTYSYACLDSAVGGSATNKAISKTTGLIRDLAVSKKDITDEVESSYGEAFHKDAIESKTFVLQEDPTINAQLQNVLADLLAARQSPSGIKYSIHLINDKQINAFTFGGYIYLTTANDKKAWLLAEKAFFLIQQKRMKGILKESLQQAIRQQMQASDFNLYRFIQPYL